MEPFLLVLSLTVCHGDGDWRGHKYALKHECQGSGELVPASMLLTYQWQDLLASANVGHFHIILLFWVQFWCVISWDPFWKIHGLVCWGLKGALISHTIASLAFDHWWHHFMLDGWEVIVKELCICGCFEWLWFLWKTEWMYWSACAGSKELHQWLCRHFIYFAVSLQSNRLVFSSLLT